MAPPRVRAWAGPLGVALALASLAAGGVCAVQAAGAWLAVNNPDLALRYGLANPDALGALAEEQFADARRPGPDAKAIEYARRALVAAPLDERAVRVLALETEREGGLARARMLMVIADRLSRRDTLAQLWLFEHALSNQDWGAASLHADALIRRRPDLEGIVFPPLIGVMGDPDAVAALVDRLDKSPGWRPVFLVALVQKAVDPADAARVFEALAATPAPPKDSETGQLINRYVGHGDYRVARALWFRLLPRDAGRTDAKIYNGDFRSLRGVPPFNWRLIQSNDASAEYDRAADGFPALRASASATGAATLAEQLLTLAPGAYRLSGAALAGTGPPGDLLSWRVSCVGQDDAAAAEARQGGGSAEWRAFSVDFIIPTRSCDAQWLRLVALGHDGDEPAETWYRGLAIRPLGSPPRPG